MFKNLRLKHRILLGYSIPLLLSLAVAIVAFVCTKIVTRQNADLTNIYRINYLSLRLKLNMTRLQNSARGYILIKDENILKRFQKAVDDYNEVMITLKKMVHDPKQVQDLQEIQALGLEIIQHHQKKMDMVREGKVDQAISTFKSGVGIKLVGNYTLLTDNFQSRQQEILRQAHAAFDQASDMLILILIGGTIIIIVFAVLAGLWIAARTSNLINNTAMSISTSATEIAVTVTQHERTAREQASMVSETNITVDELSASARQSAEQASSAAELARRAWTLTEEGNLEMRQAIEAINILKNKVEILAEQIFGLGEQSTHIGTIANIVKDLAMETNMLALNAAVEAARAGEQGKGFAVVATEVRKLADQSKKSAEKASVLITEIQKATNSTIVVTEESTNIAGEVAQRAKKVEELFNILANEANRVFENAQQVVLNAKQQDMAYTQIVEAMNNINAGSKETAAGLSQTKTGIQNLEAAARKLDAIV